MNKMLLVLMLAVLGIGTVAAASSSISEPTKVNVTTQIVSINISSPIIDYGTIGAGETSFFNISIGNDGNVDIMVDTIASDMNGADSGNKIPASAITISPTPLYILKGELELESTMIVIPINTPPDTYSGTIDFIAAMPTLPPKG